MEIQRQILLSYKPNLSCLNATFFNSRFNDKFLLVSVFRIKHINESNSIEICGYNLWSCFSERMPLSLSKSLRSRSCGEGNYFSY